MDVFIGVWNVLVLHAIGDGLDALLNAAPDLLKRVTPDVRPIGGMPLHAAAGPALLVVVPRPCHGVGVVDPGFVLELAHHRLEAGRRDFHEYEFPGLQGFENPFFCSNRSHLRWHFSTCRTSSLSLERNAPSSCTRSSLKGIPRNAAHDSSRPARASNKAATETFVSNTLARAVPFHARYSMKSVFAGTAVTGVHIPAGVYETWDFNHPTPHA